MENLIILGSGPAGLTAAIYASRANLSPLVVTGKDPGGQLMFTTEVENYPGFENGILGPDLINKMWKQAEKFGTRFLNEEVIKVDFSDQKSKKIFLENGQIYEAKSIIIATGASAKWLNVEGEEKFKGRGVSSCAVCDGSFFRNKIVAVVGGGDSAMEEANFLSKLANKVYIIHRRSEFRASFIMQEKVFKNPKIEIIWNTIVKKFLGENKLEKVLLESTIDSKEKILEVDGVFIAIGHTPNTSFLGQQIELDQNGYIKTFDINQTNTSVKGVFVAGDVFDHRYRQAITAAGSGCKAALEAEKYLDELE